MLRFLLPAFLMVGALVALFAGALGDWQGLSDSWDRLHTAVASRVPERPAAAVVPAQPTAVSPSAPAPGGDAQQAATDTLRRQVAGLQAQVAQRTQELASLHADTDQARQALETLRQQQQTEAALNARREEQARQVEARAQARRQRRNAVPAPPAFASAQPGPGPVVPPWTQLIAAREVLASGRTQDARTLLATAETQMVFQPVTPDQPETVGGNRAATAVGEAIRLVDSGDIDQAIQAINRVIDITKSQGQGASFIVPAPAAPPYPAPTGYRFANQP
jgi:TolA-binding protein